MIWSKKAALEKLGIVQEPFKPKVEYADRELHGYAFGNHFAVNPESEFKGAAGFHEMSHIVLGHTFGRADDVRNVPLEEVEACASAILCLKALGAKEAGIEAQRAHYLVNRESVKALPANFKERVNRAAQLLLEAGNETTQSE